MDRKTKNTYNTIKKFLVPSNTDAYNDMRSLLINEYRQGKSDGSKFDSRPIHPYLEEFRGYLKSAISVYAKEEEWGLVETFYDMYYETYLIEAEDSFDAYCMYLESGRPPKERFYEPRRKKLKKVVNALQDLEDDKLDELGISMPPRVGKTTIVLFYTTWILGKYPEKANLYVSYSDIITGTFFDGIQEIFTDKSTYKWGDIFSGKDIAFKNAKEETIDVGRKKRYHSLTCRSLYGTLNGSCDCTGILIGDDLIGGIEEAMNPDRLENAWLKVNNNMLTRAKQKAKILWIGTRWSINDPEGRRFDMLEHDKAFKNKRFVFISMPALDENDESNFDYDYDVGFSTQYYHERRASFEHNDDMASWQAQYQNEPIEREGSLFTSGALKYFTGIPEVEPDRRFACIDVAFGGGDYTAMPVCYQYGDLIYVVDCVYNNGDKAITQPMIAHKLKQWKIDSVQLEATRATQSYVDELKKRIKAIGYHLTIVTQSAPTNTSKELRIFDCAPDIRERFVFMEEGDRSNEYAKAMNEMFAFTLTGKNKHDDWCDSLSMCDKYAFKPWSTKAVAVRRRF